MTNLLVVSRSCCCWVSIACPGGTLEFVSGVLEKDDVGGIENDGPVTGVLVEDILDQVNEGGDETCMKQVLMKQV